MHVHEEELATCNEKIKKLENELTYGIINNFASIDHLYTTNKLQIQKKQEEIQKAVDFLYKGMKKQDK